MINVVIPMAGLGSRFQKEGYKDPKPFIDVAGKHMIQWVIDNFKDLNAKFIFICRKEHLENYSFSPDVNHEIITIDKLTEGSLCTVLKARKLIDTDEELLIANSDQYLDWNVNDFYNMIKLSKCDGSIVTFYANHPKWSYIKLNDEGYVTQVKEKEIISNMATVGIYYFKSGKDFVYCADEIINRNERVNGEFYTAPVYNVFINSLGKRVIEYPVSVKSMHGLGTPEDLNIFLKELENRHAVI